MSDDFKPGDQAQCVRNTDYQDNLIPNLQLFNIYTVTDLQVEVWFCLECFTVHEQVQIRLKEVDPPDPYWGFLPEWFRKPPPLPAEDIERKESTPLVTIREVPYRYTRSPRRIRELEPTS